MYHYPPNCLDGKENSWIVMYHNHPRIFKSVKQYILLSSFFISTILNFQQEWTLSPTIFFYLSRKIKLQMRHFLILGWLYLERQAQESLALPTYSLENHQIARIVLFLCVLVQIHALKIPNMQLETGFWMGLLSLLQTHRVLVTVITMITH